MPTVCSPSLFEFAPVETRRVVADFGGGAITSDAGALLLGATDRAIGLVRRFAGCFRDARAPERIEHDIATLVGQRVFGIALGYESQVPWPATVGVWSGFEMKLSRLALCRHIETGPSAVATMKAHASTRSGSRC